MKIPWNYLCGLIIIFVWANASAQQMMPQIGFGRLEFAASKFDIKEFGDAAKIQEHCATLNINDSSFLCQGGALDGTLTRIPTKGVDFFFDHAGHLVAAFAKQQKGMRLNKYNIDAQNNVIPFQSTIPGGALTIDGDFVVPEVLDSSWRQIDETTFLGSFRIQIADFLVEKLVRVSNVSHTYDLEVTVSSNPVTTEAEEGDDVSTPSSSTFQIVFPGVGNESTPEIKTGQKDASLDSFGRPVENPTYISLQSKPKRGFSIIVTPGKQDFDDLSALALPPNKVAMQKTINWWSLQQIKFDLQIYTGPNELVRYYQEGYSELPGLFQPNILGRLSVGIIWVLQKIHEYGLSWGMSIIVLTLLFRIIIWPLITTQTRSMLGMTKLQPKIQALQKKYKDNKEKLTQETMKLYKEAGVNPAGGCLPILVQMPLFIILWRVFVNFEFNEGFLWVPDLGQADPYFILPILYVGVMLGQSWFAAKGNPSSLRQQVIINLVFAFIILSFPAGVILYFVVSMGVQVLQYWLVSRNEPEPALSKAK